MSLYKTLKAAKLGTAPDVYTTLRAQIAPFAKGGRTPTEKELEDTPPLSFSANGDNLIAWAVYGNMTQTGTPTPSNPIYPTEFGDIVTTGEHSGEYTITITNSGTTTNIYLDEPLRKIASYSDIKSKSAETRNIKKIVFTGEENWTKNTTAVSGTSLFLMAITDALADVAPICTHYIGSNANSYKKIPTNGITVSVMSGSTQRMVVNMGDTFTETEEFTSYLAEQYAAGTPVCLWYVLAESTTESIEAPAIPTVNGSNTIDIDKTLPPSKMYIKYKE